MKCKICSNSTLPIFTATLLQKYSVQYFKCPACGFMQTEQPYWLKEAYQNAIASLDVGYVARNITYSNMVFPMLKMGFNAANNFLDYGGGYGLFVRLMRDKGLNFYRQDAYCDNIFAQHFDIQHITWGGGKFELATAFEVFEHLENPLAEIEKMLQYSNSILFSTLLQPKVEIKSVDDWWYFAAETGQHIAFYTTQSLLLIAKRFGLNLYTNGNDLHLLTMKKFSINLIKYLSHSKISTLVRRCFRSRKSLIQQDFEHVKRLIIK